MRDLRRYADYYGWLTVVFAGVIIFYFGPLVVGSIFIWHGFMIDNFYFLLGGFLIVYLGFYSWYFSIRN